MRKLNPKTKLYQFLEMNGYLTGDIQAFNEGKREYRRQYKNEHQRNQRKILKAVRFWYNKVEYKEIRDHARLYKMPVSRFAKEAVLHYIQKTLLIPDIRQIAKIRQLLHLINSGFQDTQGLLLQHERDTIMAQLQLTNDLFQRIFYIPAQLQKVVFNSENQQEAIVELYNIISKNDNKSLTTQKPVEPKSIDTLYP